MPSVVFVLKGIEDSGALLFAIVFLHGTLAFGLRDGERHNACCRHPPLVLRDLRFLRFL
jgi:hypothetical protein